MQLGRELGLNEGELRDLRYGAVFHDIGKIAVPDAILNKPGPLDEDERAIVRRHPVVGEQILAPVPFLAGVRRIVRHNHTSASTAPATRTACATTRSRSAPASCSSSMPTTR